jgi:RNA polymerase sigma factor (sigma-70 family)
MAMERSPEQVLDELLVLRAQDGDEAAFAALVDRWQRRLWRHALQLTERGDVAADVLQEAWLAIARGICRLEDPACFPRWAMQIVSRKSADWVRGRKRERTMLENLTNERRELREQPLPSPDEQATAMRAALNSLPSDRRALLSMIYLDELSIAEVAEVLDVPPGTVKSRLFHARSELKQLLEGINHERTG